MTILELARRYEVLGINVIPIKTDASKATLLETWKPFQDRLANEIEIKEWFGGRSCGLAAIAGKVSGNLEIYDFDDAGYFNAWWELVETHLGKDFMERLLVVRTPRPGFHVHTRCSIIGNNQKLALMRMPDKTLKVVIETRAQGGYVLLPGSPADCHETGRLYEIHQGKFEAIPQITPEERDVLMSAARSFNEEVRSEAPEDHLLIRDKRNRSLVGNQYAESVTWSDVLKPHGFKPAGCRGDTQYWTRPGKEHGISASTNYSGSDLFYSFSTNCFPFDHERGYGKFAVYTYLNHSGDFHQAASALVKAGYKHEPITVPRSVPIIPQNEPQPSDIIEPLSLKDQLEALYATGRQPGISPGWLRVGAHWTLRKREWTLITGIPSHGKSSFVDHVIVNVAKNNGWKWAVWSSESRPYEDYVSDLMEKYVGRPFNDGFHRRISLAEKDQALTFFQNHFRFLAPPEDEESVDRVLKCAEALVSSFGIDGLVIDPWNELNHDYGKALTETEYISRCLKKIRRLASRSNIHILVVAHPMKLRKDPNGRYPIPTPYDVSGSAHWRNKADCALCVWRDEAIPGESILYIQKIRRRYVGKLGSVNLYYDSITGRYSEGREPGEEG